MLARTFCATLAMPLLLASTALRNAVDSTVPPRAPVYTSRCHGDAFTQSHRRRRELEAVRHDGGVRRGLACERLPGPRRGDRRQRLSRRLVRAPALAVPERTLHRQ